MTMFNTLLLDLTNWDLVADSNGNIAMAQPPYALAQDVASAAKTFLGEVYYDDTIGIPYFQQLLGKGPPIGLVEALFANAAKTVPGVVTARCIIQSYENRKIVGQIQFTDENGTLNGVTF